VRVAQLMDRSLRWAVAMAAIALVIVVALCASTWSGAFLSDDWSLVAHANRVLDEGRALAYLAGAFVQAEGLQTGFYRPVGLVSWVLSATHSGIDPPGWRAANLFLHVLNGWLVLRLVRRIADTPHAHTVAWLAAAAFWLYPLAPEASVWIAARFDQLALAGVLIACERHLASRRMLDLPRVTSLFALAFALGSKESAILGPALMFLCGLMVADERAPALGRVHATLHAVARNLRDCVPALALLLAYFLLRLHLFGHVVQVYSVHTPLQVLDPAEILRRLAAMAPVLQQPFGVHALWLVGAILVVLGIGAFTAARSGRWLRWWLLPGCASVLTVIALVVHFAGTESNGLGARMLYATGAWLAIWLFLPFAGVRAGRTGLLCAAPLLIVFAVYLAISTNLWREAGLAMRALLPVIVDTSHELHARGEFGVVLIPDHLRTAAFARNAQGGIGAGGIVPVNPHAGSIVMVVPFVPEVVDHFTARGRIDFGNGRSLRTFCVDALPWTGEVRLVETPLGTPLTQPAAWWNEWSAAVAASACADDFPDLR